MRIFRSFAVAFSTYSKIPMPQFAWEEEDMKYSMIFFPWVGAVLGALLLGWEYLAAYMGVGLLGRSLVGTALPLLVTGGFHMDGYMDTMDALHSYKSKEEKLKILKDPHIGAFAVLMLILYYLLYLAGYSEVHSKRYILLLGICFMVSRILSGLSVLYFPKAKKDGMMKKESDAAQNVGSKIGLILELILAIVGLWILQGKVALLLLAGGGLLFWYYYGKSKKEFGGITGDLAGWFVSLFELLMVLLLAIAEKIPWFQM